MAESEDEPARLNQDIMEAGSSTAEYDGTKRRKVEVEEGRRQQDITKLEDKSAYDVFLSFRRYSSRDFADSLSHRLQADGILVFREEGILGTSKMLARSVYSSKIYVPIFSADYAYSPWSLEKLALMVERTSRSVGKKEILPIFYDVERSEVELEKESLFRDLLDTHKQSLGDEKAEQWKKALVEAGKKGWELSSYKGEEELIAAIVGQISLKLKAEQNYVPEDPFAGAHPMLSYRTSGFVYGLAGQIFAPCCRDILCGFFHASFSGLLILLLLLKDLEIFKYFSGHF